MAVKAQAEITLSAVRDVQATYRYYLLQSSTLSAPSKPTAQPPGGSWDDTEPSYTSGSTNSLYLVDCTVFSDGSFSYSEVSLSSSYEAAKEAYNVAQAAQATADNAQESADAVNTRLTDQITTFTKTCDQMILSALEEYTTTTDLDQQIETLTAQLKLMSDNVTISLTNTNQRITSAQSDLQSQITDVSSYFQFTTDGLLIGKSDDALTLQVSSDRVSFLDGGMEVAYVSDKALYVTDGYFINSLQVGGFAWQPRSTGNLSFIKVGD
jgi:hypothetical protein